MTTTITTMTIISPPSPALSVCDSLADIDDLDAFLSAQGPLSYFPTPGLDSRTASTHCNLHHGHQQSWDTQTLGSSTQLSTYDTHDEIELGSWLDIRLVNSLLSRCRLADEVAAIACNILDRLQPHEQAQQVTDKMAELVTIAALALVEIHISDHPHPFSYWARTASYPTTAREVDITVMEILKWCDWSIIALCQEEAVLDGMALLEGRRRCRPSMDSLDMPPLSTGSSCASLWVNGQITPAECSPARGGDKAELSSFLPSE